MKSDATSDAKAAHICHALDMLSALPQWTEHAAFPPEVRIACLESYFVNYRLLAEFLVRSPNGKDFSRRDFVVGWDPTPSSNVDRIDEDWEFASQNVVHLSLKRLPEQQEVIPSVDPQVLALMAARLTSVFSEFVGKCGEANLPEHTMFRLALEHAEKEINRLI